VTPGSYNRIYVGGVVDVATCCPIVKEFSGDVDELVAWAK
jgi:hypothetical protein